MKFASVFLVGFNFVVRKTDPGAVTCVAHVSPLEHTLHCVFFRHAGERNAPDASHKTETLSYLLYANATHAMQVCDVCPRAQCFTGQQQQVRSQHLYFFYEFYQVIKMETTLCILEFTFGGNMRTGLPDLLYLHDNLDPCTLYNQYFKSNPNVR